jgi:hypothetical protein
MIYGLSFATILTLIVLPVMYVLSERFGNFIRRIFGSKPAAEHDEETMSQEHPGTEEGPVTN